MMRRLFIITMLLSMVWAQGKVPNVRLKMLDGSSAKLYDYLKDGPIVMVRLLGACAGCAMSADTMKLGIERLIQERFPEVKQVIQV